MKLIWYLMVKYYMRLGFVFYYKKLQIVGIENVPKNKAILFVANHQNALIDPLILGAYTPRELHFLTKADVFSKPLISALLSSVNMLPIYRIRDGLNSIAKNEEIFEKCYNILGKKGTVLIFPEGSHNLQRRVRPLNKGFARIVFGALDKYPGKEIVVIPVGLNYSNATTYASSVSIHYGKPILVNDFWPDQDANAAFTALKTETTASLKKLISHIENSEQHDAIVKSFREEDFLYPKMVNEKLKRTQDLRPLAPEKTSSFNFLTPIVTFNSIIPIMIWKRIYPNIKEKEYISTYRFSFGITAFPFFYLLQAWIIHLFMGNTAGSIYLIFSFLSVFLLTKSK